MEMESVQLVTHTAVQVCFGDDIGGTKQTNKRTNKMSPGAPDEIVLQHHQTDSFKGIGFSFYRLLFFLGANGCEKFNNSSYHCLTKD